MHGGFINPEQVIAQIGLKEGMKIADFGCGHGYFTIPAAKLVGKDGRVYAVDVLLEALSSVRSLAQLQGILNIETTRGDLEIIGGSKISENSIDAVLLHNVLFQTKNKEAIISEAVNVLKQGGILAVADWLPEKNSSLGPKNDSRVLAQDVKKLCTDKNFSLTGEFDAGEYHFGLLFVKE